MKKVYSLLTMAVIAAMSLTLTSCDSDDYWNGHYGWNINLPLTAYRHHGKSLCPSLDKTSCIKLISLGTMV